MDWLRADVEITKLPSFPIFSLSLSLSSIFFIFLFFFFFWKNNDTSRRTFVALLTRCKNFTSWRTMMNFFFGEKKISILNIRNNIYNIYERGQIRPTTSHILHLYGTLLRVSTTESANFRSFRNNYFPMAAEKKRSSVFQHDRVVPFCSIRRAVFRARNKNDRARGSSERCPRRVT